MKLTNLNAFKIKHSILNDKNIRHFQENFLLLEEKDRNKAYKIATKAHDKFIKKYEHFLTRGKVLNIKKDGDAIAEVNVPKRILLLLCTAGTGAACGISINHTHDAVPISLAIITLLLAAETVLFKKLCLRKDISEHFTFERYKFPMEHRKKVKLENKIQKLKEVLDIITEERRKEVLNASEESAEQIAKIKELDEKLKELSDKNDRILSILNSLNADKDNLDGVPQDAFDEEKENENKAADDSQTKPIIEKNDEGMEM